MRTSLLLFQSPAPRPLRCLQHGEVGLGDLLGVHIPRYGARPHESLADVPGVRAELTPSRRPRGGRPPGHHPHTLSLSLCARGAALRRPRSLCRSREVSFFFVFFLSFPHKAGGKMNLLLKISSRFGAKTPPRSRESRSRVATISSGLGTRKTGAGGREVEDIVRCPRGG